MPKHTPKPIKKKQTPSNSRVKGGFDGAVIMDNRPATLKIKVKSKGGGNHLLESLGTTLTDNRPATPAGIGKRKKRVKIKGIKPYRNPAIPTYSAEQAANASTNVPTQTPKTGTQVGKPTNTTQLPTLDQTSIKEREKERRKKKRDEEKARLKEKAEQEEKKRLKKEKKQKELEKLRLELKQNNQLKDSAWKAKNDLVPDLNAKLETIIKNKSALLKKVGNATLFENNKMRIDNCLKIMTFYADIARVKKTDFIKVSQCASACELEYKFETINKTLSQDTSVKGLPANKINLMQKLNDTINTLKWNLASVSKQAYQIKRKYEEYDRANKEIDRIMREISNAE